MPKNILHFLLAFELLILASQACSGAPTVAALDPNAINTAIAETAAAAGTQTAAQEARIIKSPTSTITPTRAMSMTPFPTFTLVLAVPRVYVTKSTFCRTGPGQAYQDVGAVKVGEAVQVVGRSRDAKYWIIRNPRNPKQICWLSGKYASVTGAAGALPVFTAPPPPTATKTPKPPTAAPPPTVVVTSVTTTTVSFTASYQATQNCTGAQWWVQFNLVNTGGATFQSIGIAIQDITTGDPIIAATSDDFTVSNGCSSDTVDTLPPGASHQVSPIGLTYDPTGHQLVTDILLCTEPGLGGTCVPVMLNVTP